MDTRDALALFTLLGASLAISQPILAGGYRTYIDNSVHLAEILELAGPAQRGWSELSFAGFPLGTLHSPLCYGALALLVRLGLPVEPLYAAALVLSFAAPALAVYWVGRARVSRLAATFVAYLSLVQAPQITGIGSPLGGMWTHALALAALVLLTELAARSELSRAARWWSCALLAFIGLTHLFVLLLAVLVLGLAALFLWRERTIGVREIMRRMLGYGLAALTSASYWLTFVMTSAPEDAPARALGPQALLTRLLLPSDAFLLLMGKLRGALRSDLYFTDALPMIGLIGLALAGLGSAGPRRDAATKTAVASAVLVFGTLCLNHSYTIDWLGPVSWRLLAWVSLAAAFPAFAAAAELERRLPASRRSALAGAVLAVLLGFWWSTPLRRDQPDPADVSAVGALWSWLKDNARPEWTRVYLQDTFGQSWRDAGMSHSHLLALTKANTGLPQLGAYYGIVPYATRWTLSEFNNLFGEHAANGERIAVNLDKVSASVFVASDYVTAQALATSADFRKLHELGRYSVWQLRTNVSGLVAPLRPSNHAGRVAFEIGDVRFPLKVEYPNGRVLLKTTYHPWWRLDGIDGALLRESPEGFLVIDKIRPGTYDVHLRYRPSSAPNVLSALGAAVLAAWAVVLGLRARRGMRGSAPA